MTRWPLILTLLLLLGGGAAWSQEAPALTPELDPFSDVRRADGTLRWNELLKGEPQAGPRLANFSLETFLRELTHVIQAGDNERTREFFDGVIATDFYTTYGVFAISATAVELGYDMAYRRYLHRYVKPRVASGMLRTNLALSTGIALAELVNGDLQGKSFAISLGSLGISSALVEASASRIPALRRFKRSFAAKNASKLLKTGGFVYQTAELALVFFVGRLIEEKFYAVRSVRNSREDLEAAGTAALAGLAAATTPLEAEACLRAYEGAWTTYRNVLYAPLIRDQQAFLDRLSGLAEDAKIADDVVHEALARAARYPNLPLADYQKHKAAEAQLKLEHELSSIANVYVRDASEHFAEVYRGRLMRQDPFQPALDLSRSSTGTAITGRLFVRGHKRTSRNRLQTYDQQLTALAVLRELFPQHAPALAASGERIKRVRVADQELAEEGSPLSLLGLGPSEPAALHGLSESVQGPE